MGAVKLFFQYLILSPSYSCFSHLDDLGSIIWWIGVTIIWWTGYIIWWTGYIIWWTGYIIWWIPFLDKFAISLVSNKKKGIHHIIDMVHNMIDGYIIWWTGFIIWWTGCILWWIFLVKYYSILIYTCHFCPIHPLMDRGVHHMMDGVTHIICTSTCSSKSYDG